jgi:hypothetical protein
MSEILLSLLRWAARLAALGLACMYTLMIVGEFASPHSGPPTHLVEWAGIGLLTLTCAGALLAWKWELAGAILSLGSLAAFLVLLRIRADIVVLVAATPAVLFLADWIAHQSVARHLNHHHRAQV